MSHADETISNALYVIVLLIDDGAKSDEDDSCHGRDEPDYGKCGCDDVLLPTEIVCLGQRNNRVGKESDEHDDTHHECLWILEEDESSTDTADDKSVEALQIKPYFRSVYSPLY